MKIFWLSLLLLTGLFGSAQVAINNDGSPPDSSAILDLQSSSLGLLIPRMTFIQRNAIENPKEGLMVICTNCSRQGNPVLSIFQAGSWMTYPVDCVKPAYPFDAGHIPELNAITWNWHKAHLATGYKLGTTTEYEAATDIGQDTSYTETGLNCWTPYERYIWAYNDCGHTQFPNYLSDTTLPLYIASPEPDMHVADYYQVHWNWLPVSQATGYKWNTKQDIGSALDLGNSLSYLEYGLYCNHTDTSYVWAYDSCGISEPAMLIQVTSDCPPDCQPFTDTRDNRSYNTVLINEQCWMRENLDIGRIYHLQANNGYIDKYHYCDAIWGFGCFPEFGGLYTWDEMMQYGTVEGSKGICPEGFHLPTDGEWQLLCDNLGGFEIAGTKLKGKADYNWMTWSGTNESAFTALPGGTVCPTSYPGSIGRFWTSTAIDANDAMVWGMDNEVNSLARMTQNQNSCFNVRCIKN